MTQPSCRPGKLPFMLILTITSQPESPYKRKDGQKRYSQIRQCRNDSEVPQKKFAGVPPEVPDTAEDKVLIIAQDEVRESKDPV